MKAIQIYKRLEVTANVWEKELEKYSDEDFQSKSAHNLWTIGQVYEHITSNSLNFHAVQIERCLLSSVNTFKTKSLIGYLCLTLKRIPHIKIKISPEENIEPSQPVDIQFIKNRLNEVKEQFFYLALAIDSSKIKGKINHPGMGYLHAKEWLVFIEMHIRHHWKDKQKIDSFLFR